MTPLHRLRRRGLAVSACSLAAGAAVIVAAGTASAALDPSAYGVTASGAVHLAATPSVDWSSGPAVLAVSGHAGSGALSVGPSVVAAGSGFASSRIVDLVYGQIKIASLNAECRDGHTSLAVTGTADGKALHSGSDLTTAGGERVKTGDITYYSDGSTAITALTVTTRSGEVITAGYARCGAGS